MRKTMGKRIRELRVIRGMTQQDLADRMYVRKSTISAYENDAIDIKCSVLIEMAKVLNTIPEYFFSTGKDEPETYEAVGLIEGIRDARLRRAAVEHVRITRRFAELQID